MSFSGLGITLSLVFGCFLLVLLLAELYYLVSRKKGRTNTGIETNHKKYAKGVFYGVCRKKPSPLDAANNPVRVVNRVSETSKSHEPDLELGTDMDVLQKTYGEESVESELMRLHNLTGPPRFLFTIKEETKEDLESEDGKSRSRKGSRTRSLSDLMVTIDTPFLTPLASSPLKCSLDNTLDSYKHQGVSNPLFESSSVESELNKFRSSPPPNFKFLRDAEEKLYRRLIEEARRKAQKNLGSDPDTEFKDSPNSTKVAETIEGSYVKFIKNKEREQRELQQHLPHFPSSSSQVLPLASSPTTPSQVLPLASSPLEKASMVH